MLSNQTPDKNDSLTKEVTQVLLDFIRGQLLIAGLNGLIAGLGFFILSIKHAFILGIVVGLMSLIPYLGPVLGFIPALIMAWITHHNPWYVVGVIGIWLIIQILESLVFQPKILGTKMKMHPLMVIISIFIGGALFGPLGVLLAVPGTAVLRVLYRRIVKEN